MKALIFVLAVLILTSIRALGAQNPTGDQRQQSAEQVYGNPITVGETVRMAFEQLGEERMEERQITALNGMMAAVNAGNAKRYANLYAQDAVITIYGGVELKGRDAIEEYEVQLLRQFPGARLAFYSVWQKGALAVVHYAVNGQTGSGQAMGHEGLLFYRFHPSGLIAEERRYQDSLTPMAQLGMLGTISVRAQPSLPSEMKVYLAGSSLEETANVEIVTASFKMLDSKNEPAFLASIADDATLDEMILPQPFIGKQDVHGWFETWTRAVPDATTEITTSLGIGEYVLVEAVVRGTLKGPLGSLMAANKSFEVHRAAIVQLKDAKLTRVAIFMNGKELAEAVGQWPPAMEK